ncbi:MAG: fumarylacetoacetase, partial [Leptolyngbya sp. SIO4C5]|nr:fumarylacetoacetase [Leptolyngbya sp. SIO4C5]
CHQAGLLTDLPTALRAAVTASTLNPLMALGHEVNHQLRQRLQQLLRAGNPPPAAEQILVPMKAATMHLPATVGDYTDFYASIFHATNVGSLFRPENPLLPNYKHVPVAYHGRSSSLVVSGTPIPWPQGQRKGPDEDRPSFGPCRALDYELEVGCFIGAGNSWGQPLAIAQAESALFGFCLVNDWSARDIQAWEYQPLGPFLGKSFATTVSPWVVTLEALAPFRCPAFARPAADPAPLPYLTSAENTERGGLDLTVEVWLQTAQMQNQDIASCQLSRANLRQMYWTPAQMIAHHTSNGCNLRPGDLLASGTVSGPEAGSQGSLLEMTRRGTQPLQLPSGETRAFLAAGDTVILRGYCHKPGYVRIGLGDCQGRVLPGI